MLNRLNRRMVGVLVILCCVSCAASADVHAVRDPSYAGQISTLYLAVGQGGLDEDYANGFVKSFERELAGRGIRLTSRVVTGLELDRRLLDHEVAASHADAALMVVPVRGTTYYGEIVSLTWDVSLLDVRTGAKVWRARVENKKAAGAYGSTAGMVDEAAVGIARQLASDHLLRGGA